MLRIRPIQVLLIPVIACSIIEEHESSATRNAANTSIDVCFYIKKGHPRSCKTFENLTTLGEFMSKPHVKVEIHDQFLTKLHKYSFSRIMYTKELVIANCGVLEIEPGAFHNSLSLLKFDIQRNRLEILREGVFNGLLISHLNLAHNKIRTIDPDALSNMQNIEEVNLLNNLISVYDVKWFNKTPLLKSLCFQNNTIREIPETAFRNLIDMKHGMNLFYSFNMIKTVHPKAFQGMGKTKINKLLLDHNLLENWGEELSLNINELEICFNSIRCIEGNLHVTIKNNSLRNFIGNPYDCACLKEMKTIGDNRGERSNWFSNEYAKCRAFNKSGLKQIEGSNIQVFSSRFESNFHGSKFKQIV